MEVRLTELDEFIVKAMLRGGMRIHKIDVGWLTEITNEPGDFWNRLPTERQVQRMWRKLAGK